MDQKCSVVENSCRHLTALLINTIRTKILKLTEPVEEYTFGEALCLWLANLLLRSKLLTTDQLRVVLEEFGEHIRQFGNEVRVSMQFKAKVNEAGNLVKPALPVCKIGILDRKFVCIDGVAFFIDLEKGTKIQTLKTMPIETISFNLTALLLHAYLPKDT